MVAVASPILLILFGCTAMYLLLDVQLRTLSTKRKIVAAAIFAALIVFNIVARPFFGKEIYAKFYALFVQIPLLVLFYVLSRYKGIKLFFAMLTTVVLASPSILMAQLVKGNFETTMAGVLAANIFSYITVLLLVYFFLKPSLNYMLEFGEDKLFWMFSVIPILFYIYSFGLTKYNFGAYTISENQWLHLVPDMMVYTTYPLLIYIFKTTREKNRMQAEREMMRMSLDEAGRQMKAMVSQQEQATVYRHDLRHHFTLLSGFAANGDIENIKSYLTGAQNEISAITPIRYCQNETVHIILSAYVAKAKPFDVTLHVQANLPQTLNVQESELCALFSNGLENAIAAAAKADLPLRIVRVDCSVHKGNVLIIMENPFVGEVTIENGLPKQLLPEHGFGTKSMMMIAKRYHGYCGFTAQNGVFTVKIVLPLGAQADANTANTDAAQACAI